MSQFRKQFPVVILAIILAGALSLSIASATLSPLTPPPTDGYNVGDILDPGCAPTDIDCLINPASFRGVAYGTNATSGHDDEVLYLNGSGDVYSDSKFTRDSITNYTNITRDFSYTVNTISVDVAPVLIIGNISGSFNDGDSILNTTDGTSTATVIKSLQGAGNALIITNISGSFNDGDSILNTTDGTSTAQLQVFSSSFNQGDTWRSFNIVNNNHTASGNIVGVSGNTYDLGTSSFGNVSQYDLLFDTLVGQPNKLVGIISVSSISNPGSITTGFITDNNYAGFGLQGSYLYQSDGVTSMDFGVFDLSAFGASRTSAGIVSIDQNTGASTTFIAAPAGSSGSISLGVQSPTNDIVNFQLGNVGFSLLTNLSGGGTYGIGSSGSNLYWRTNSNTYTLPQNLPNQDDVLTVSSVSGSDVILGWAPGGGSNPWSAYTIPSDGGNGQVLSTDGSGILSWIDAGGILPDQTNHDGEFLTTNSGILSWTSNIGSYVPLSYMGANNGVATLDANGKIPSSQLAALAINNSFVVSSEIDMLALAANTGDIAVRTDISSTFVLSGTDPTVLSDWVQLLWQPTVISVNGQTGVVSLNTDNIGEGSTNLYFTNSRVNSAITAYLPTQAGNSGRVLSTDGAGNLSWVVQSGSGSGNSPIQVNLVDTLYSGTLGAGEGDINGTGRNIFLGRNAGDSATSTYQSTFIGFLAGSGAISAHDSIFIGALSGAGAISANNSNFFGQNTGYGAENAYRSNFFGIQAGYGAIDAYNSNFFGSNAGSGATNASNANFFGAGAGNAATNASFSNFFGGVAGSGATDASYSNFFGASVGQNAINANNSNFFGSSAGNGATDASYSNFFGASAGYNATNADHSNFLGVISGGSATYASYSNFIGTSAGQAAINANNSNFFGQNTGYGAENADHSNFFGNGSGYQAVNANNSNFLGDGAGLSAENADHSNFLGLSAGQNAINASNSNFFGASAGYSAIGAFESNFFGANTGSGASSAIRSNFFGTSAGFNATNASYSNFFGYNAGQSAENASDSNFFGNNAGREATEAASSNFFGPSAGYQAVSAEYANFFGNNAGYQATNAIGSNFFGPSTGQQATNASYSNFFGYQAGYNATNASYSNFLGYAAGYGAFSVSSANFLGTNAGKDATDATQSNFFGSNAGQNATNAAYSNFFGVNAGSGATDADFSNFIGYLAGTSAESAFGANFIGRNSGYNADNAGYSNFIGPFAGNAATNASYSNFLGYAAGQEADNAGYSNFFGINAGYQAASADHSNFLGNNAGQQATNANNSFFVGNQTGEFATNANDSTFIGAGAGYNATNASKSIFIGRLSGYNDTANNTTAPDDFSILIGNNTLTGGFENSIALGAYATNTASNQFMIGSATRPIDITRINGSASTQCTITTGTGIACTSDERLKTNITDLTNTTLENLLKVKTVTYNWLQNPTSKTQIGFLAQDLEQYFPELVDTDTMGMKSVYYAQMTPILVEAIRELNFKVENIILLAPSPETTSFLAALSNWLGDITNGIQKIFAHEVQTDKLCVGNTCVDEQQLQQLLQNQNIQSTGPSIIPPSDPEITPPEEDPGTPTVTPDPGTDSPSGDDSNSNPVPPPVTDTPVIE